LKITNRYVERSRERAHNLDGKKLKLDIFQI